MKTLHHFPSKYISNKCKDTALQQTTLEEIQRSYQTTKLSRNQSHNNDERRNELFEISQRESIFTQQHSYQREFSMIEVNGKCYKINYGSVKSFQKSFKKIDSEDNPSFSLALKMVLLQKIVRGNKQFSSLLGKTIEKYGQMKFSKIPTQISSL